MSYKANIGLWIVIVVSSLVFTVFLYYYLKLRRKKRIYNSFFSFYSYEKKDYIKLAEEKLNIIKSVNKMIRLLKLKITLAQFLIISVMAALVGGAVGYFGTDYIVFGMMCCIGCGYAPYIIISNKERKRVKEISHQIGPMLKHMSNYLRAGNNLRQSIEKTALVTEDLLGEVLEQIIKTINGGLAINKSVELAMEYVPTMDFRMFYILVSIHNDMGGDLASSLDNLAMVIDDRKALKEEIDSITQETKASAYITAIIPAILFLVLKFTSPDYMKQVEDLPFGKAGLFGSFLFIGLGVFLVLKISAVKVDKAYR